MGGVKEKGVAAYQAAVRVTPDAEPHLWLP